MGFELDAFISYAHIDNEPLTSGHEGWVTQFHTTLRAMLSQRLGQPAKIWRDTKLGGNDVFGDEIADKLLKTATLVSIFSPRYVLSDSCKRELCEFCEAAAHSGGLVCGTRSRVFKVIKTPFDAPAPLPDVVQRTLGYEFYDLDDGDPQELDPAFGEQARQQFLTRLSNLARELAASLKQLAQATPPDAARASDKPVVFLADCGRDMRASRELLAIDLRMHGYEVLPAGDLSHTEDELTPELNAQLERSALSIHLVGGSVGLVPDGPSGRSVVMLQNALAAERARHASLRRIIWLPAGVAGERPEQQAFIDALQSDAALQYGADLMRGDIEAVKAAIHAALNQIENPPAPTVPAPVSAAGQKVVHILMSEADRSASIPLIKLLRAQGFAVTTPLFAGSAAELREANSQLVGACDAVLLFYGAGDEVWKFHQQSELRKLGAAAGSSRTRVEWTLLAAPMTPDKQMLVQLEEPALIDASAGLSDAALAPFFQAVKA